MIEGVLGGLEREGNELTIMPIEAGGEVATITELSDEVLKNTGLEVENQTQSQSE